MKSNVLALLTLTTIFVVSQATAADSTAIKPSPAIPAIETYLLAHGKVSTQIGNYEVRIDTTAERCHTPTIPSLVTSLSGIEWFGWSQGIAGVVNNLVLNTDTYEIYGQLNAPVNVELARPNGATVTWEIWCKTDNIA